MQLTRAADGDADSDPINLHLPKQQPESGAPLRLVLALYVSSLNVISASGAQHQTASMKFRDKNGF